MTPKTESGSFTTDAASSPSQSGVIVSKRHFDTFETQFFQQGDAENAGLAGEAERFDDLDESARRKRFVPSRQFMMGVAAGSTVIAIIGCIALWRSSNANARAAASVALAPPAQAEPVAMNPAAVVPSEPPAPANPAAVAVPTQAETVPAVALLPAPAPAQPAPAAAEAVPAVPAPAAPTPPAPAQPPVPVVAEKPLAVAAEPVLAKPAVAAVEKPLPVEPAVAAVATEAQDRCKKAISDKRNKEILATCPDAFAADPSAADIAVALAKIEFDRGKSTQAASWGQKAIAADPNAADAYVFIGGAEQNAGHRKAAKEAYKRYLQLAPGGRYAADLRAIVGSL
jgi:tetratricopeptide (TPR) repeat protein